MDCINREMSSKISSVLSGYMKIIWSHSRFINVTRYKNVVIFDIPLNSEANELGDIIEVKKENHRLLITYSIKHDLEPKNEPRLE